MRDAENDENADISAVAARAHRILEPLHALSYFAPEVHGALVSAGLQANRMTYFAGRSAPMGAVGAGVVAATFYNFSPDLIARHIPRAWALAAPDQVTRARLAGVDRAFSRLLGAEALGSDAMAEAATLARQAVTGVAVEGRPLYAAHAELDWPVEPHLQLWHAITLLREHRGDGHIAALVRHGLSGIEAIISHTATGGGFVEQVARERRGWTEQQWAAAIGRLQGRDVLQSGVAGLALTEAGIDLRTRIEADTDQLATEPWRQLGVSGTARLIELATPLSRTAVANGAFPDGVFAARRD